MQDRRLTWTSRPELRRLAIVAGATPVLLVVLTALATWLLSDRPDWAASALAGIGGLVGIVTSVHAGHRRRRRLILEALETADQMFDGATVYARSGRPLKAPGGVLRGLPGLETSREIGIEHLLRDNTPVPSDDSAATSRAIAALKDGDAAELTLRMESGATLTIVQQPTGMGPVLLAATDISERVAQDEALHLRQQKFAELTEIASDWTWATDADHRFNSVSERFAELTGIEDAAIVGRRLIEIADVRAAPVAIRSFMSRLHDQEPFSAIVIPLRPRPEQGRFWVRISGRPRLTEDGRFLGFHGVAADITREYDAEQRADSASRALNDAVESVSEGLALFDRETQLVMCNGRMANDFAPAAHLLVPGTRVQDMLRAFVQGGLLRSPALTADAAFRAILPDLEGRRLDREFKMANGRWIALRLNRSADEGSVLVYSDITAHKEHEAELDAKIDELETAQAALVARKDELSDLAHRLEVARAEAVSANQAKSEFLAAMSHELRTPLNAVIGFSEVMATESLGPLGHEKYREYNEDVLSAGRHLLNLINNILDLSKAESGNLDLKAQAISLKEIVASSTRMACPTERTGTLHVRIDDNADEIVADQQKLKQILINLISNAVKFTPEGGKITVTAKRRPGWTDIAVSDTGIGMRAEDIPKALQAFQQIDSSLGRKFEGTGLGLPLAARFAELHHGRLDIESTPGSGTTVTVRIPDQRPRAAVA